jgi:hypothetical protein
MPAKPKETDALVLFDEPTEHEIVIALLRTAMISQPPTAITVAGRGVVNGTKYLAPGDAGIWLSDPWSNLLGSTNLETLMRTGAEC